MPEKALLAAPEFASLPVVRAEAADHLRRPSGLEYSGYVYEADDVSLARDFLKDPDLVPKGLYRDSGGKLRVVFWQLRNVRSSRCG
jgi:hypothetical protein